ncbi:hypothetical protein GTO27_06220 [Candidatus Bathyarchaeota archaeon]|nr:hypothetical protein [Candidatus Bathyarchaeota archaeon]
MTCSSTAGEVHRLEQDLLALEEERNKIKNNAQEWAQKRDKLNKQVRDLSEQIRNLKSLRDQQNETVKDLKRLRESTKDQAQEKIDEIRKLNSEIQSLKKKKSLKTMLILQRELDRTEWSIQTTSLSLEEEKELVGKARQLQAEINILKKLRAFQKERMDAQTKLKAIQTENRVHHQRLTETARKSQDLHKNMLRKRDELKEIKFQADETHQKFLQEMRRTEPILEKITKTRSRLRELRDELQKKDEQERRRIEEDLMKEIREKAKEKLRLGKKLTWEEFQILQKQEETTQD